MTKAKLKEMIGKNVEVTFFDFHVERGILGYTEDFSEKYNYRIPGLFTIGNYSFRVSHVRRIKEI